METSLVHVYTSDTFFIDAPKIELCCWACGTTCNHELGWVALRCSNCKMEYDIDEPMGRLAMKIRERLRLTRRQTGEELGYSPKTIKSYEWGICSSAYYKKLQVLFIQNLKQTTVISDGIN